MTSLKPSNSRTNLWGIVFYFYRYAGRSWCLKFLLSLHLSWFFKGHNAAILYSAVYSTTLYSAFIFFPSSIHLHLYHHHYNLYCHHQRRRYFCHPLQHYQHRHHHYIFMLIFILCTSGFFLFALIMVFFQLSVPHTNQPYW